MFPFYVESVSWAMEDCSYWLMEVLLNAQHKNFVKYASEFSILRFVNT